VAPPFLFNHPVYASHQLKGSAVSLEKKKLMRRKVQKRRLLCAE
jgi:hypothetical protein